MRRPIFVRALSDEEREHLVAGLRSSDAFVLRRCQILLASARGKIAREIALEIGCDGQTARTAITAFNARGVDCLARRSTRPKSTRRAFNAVQAEQLRALLYQSPRAFGKPTSMWTLPLAAEVSVAQGVIAQPVSGETVRATLVRLGVRWKRAKEWLSSPDPAYARKKKARDRLIRLLSSHPSWVVGFQDETWWSRTARPALHSWSPDDHPLRLIEQSVAQQDPDPPALAAYGLVVRQSDGSEETWLRFVDGRPLSVVTMPFLDWFCARLEARGKTTLLLVWDNASWHLSHAVTDWIHDHNQQVKHDHHGVRILSCPLPIKSPWLNPIEPRWIHAKRKIIEPARLLTARELEDRVCDALNCSHVLHLIISDNVA